MINNEMINSKYNNTHTCIHMKDDIRKKKDTDEERKKERRKERKKERSQRSGRTTPGMTCLVKPRAWNVWKVVVLVVVSDVKCDPVEGTIVGHGLVPWVEDVVLGLSL